MEFIDIPKPHGKLIYDGEQTLIPFDKELKFANPIILVSNGLAYGELTLSEQPVQTNEKTFQRKEYFSEHRVFADERKRLWPETKIFYLYKIQSFDPLPEPRKVDISNGDLVYLDEIDLNDTDKKFIDKAKKLPKTIILNENAVIVDPQMRGFGSEIKNEELSIALASVNFGNGDNEKIRQEDKLQTGFPVYDLALVKKDNFIKSVEDAPNYRLSENPDMACGNCGFNRGGFCSLYNFFWDRGYTCDSWQSDVVNVFAEAIEDRLERIQGQFKGKFSDYLGAEEWDVWVSRTFDTFVIVSYAGNFYRVRYIDEGEEVKFQGPESWVQVQYVAMEKEFEEEKAFDDSPWDGAASQWDTAEAYCSDCLIDVNGSGEKKKELCFLPYRKPGSNSPNENAIRAIGGGRGITRLKKPSDVDQSKWDAQLKKAANKVIGWWPDIFDKPAPDAIYTIAGKTPPAKSKEGRRLQTRMLKRLQEAWQTLSDMLTWASPDMMEEDDYQKQLLDMVGVKEVNGTPWYVSFSTNSFMDREKEIFSLKSLENYVNENYDREDKGYFNLWHIPNTDFARKEWQAVIGKFLVEAGPFLDNNIGQEALKFFTEYPQSHPELAPEGWGHSPEYRFLPEDRGDGVYDWVWITRTSVLPKAAAANIFTLKGDIIMAMSDDQRKFAELVVGKDNLSMIEKIAEKETAKLDEAGVLNKQKDEEVPETEEQKSEDEKVPEKEKSSDEETPKTEVPETEEKEVEEIKLSLDEIAEKAVGLINLELQPIAESMTKIIEAFNAHEKRFEKIEERLRIKELTESPKFTVSVTKPAERASESDKTKVDKSDVLFGKKPEEAKYTDGSAAGAFFGSKK